MARKNSITAILFIHSKYFSIEFSIYIKEVLNIQCIFHLFIPNCKRDKTKLIKKKTMFLKCIFMILMNIIIGFNKYIKQ